MKFEPLIGSSALSSGRSVGAISRVQLLGIGDRSAYLTLAPNKLGDFLQRWCSFTS